MVTTTIGSSNVIYKTALQPDGKILAGGYTNNGITNDFALARYTVTGTLDTTFDTDGIVTATVGVSFSCIYAIALQPDGKIVAAGSAYNGVNYDFALARYNTNGSLDTAFDTDGVITTTVGSSNDKAYAVVLQPDGRIVAAGYSFYGATDNFALVRYNDNGSLDTTFDTDGIVTTTIGSGSSYARDIALQPDGRIVAAGSNSNTDVDMVRYNSNGSLDTTFDTDGIVTTTVGSNSYANAIILQTDNRIILAGGVKNGVNYDFAMFRYNANGTFDTTFSSDGIITTTIGSGSSFVNDIILQPDGKILLAGNCDVGASYDFALVRYDSTGVPDTSFGTGGMVTTNASFGAYGNAIYAILIQADNRIIVAGYAYNGTNNDLALARYWR